MKIFDFGWENDLTVPKMIRNILEIVASGYTGNNSAVLINSTWYTDEAHGIVSKYVENHNVNNIILVSLADAYIAHSSRFPGRNCFEVGYYPGQGFYDFWACVFKKLHQQLPDQLLLDRQLIQKPFMCLNRKHHNHRVRIVDELRSAGLTDKGIVTLSGTDLRIENDVPDHASVAPESGAQIANDIVTLGRTDIWCSHFLNVVTETWWDINQVYFVSEKIYKPIVGLRPFLIWAEDMGVKWLTDRKFELYHDDFKDITDLDLTNHENMIPFLKTLSDQPNAYLVNKFVDLREKLLYNRNRFDEYVQEQDLDAVIDNMNQFLK